MTYPSVAIADQWTNGEEINSVKLNARVDANFNALLTASPVYFFGSILTSTAISIGAAMNLTTIVADSANGWDATNHWYKFSVAGLYSVSAAVKCNSSATIVGVGFAKNGTSFLSGDNGATAAFTGNACTFTAQFAVGDELFLFPTNNYTTQSDAPAHNNFMTIAQLGYI